MDADDRDAQCLAILGGIETLIDALSEPIARQAIDLDRNPMSRQYDLLLRLRDSLSQYSERSVDLFYVGLLGHFSAGKSSTINSLLGLWGQEDQRQVDWHPTDKQVTLIAHPSKISSLLGIVQEGRRVVIRSHPIASDFLAHIVLADTPGTGDPLLIEEMATDFLPVCDLLLFFISATSPLDSTDKPLLIEKVTRLPFLPMKFVVTRADEFRVSHEEPLTATNANESQVAGFLKDLVSRVNEVVGSPQYNTSDFLLVSNQPPYFNIETLRDELSVMASPTNAAARLRIHSHKVQYFARGAQDSREFFVRSLDTKLAGVLDLVSKASRNIAKYQASVIISNNRLTETWLKHLAAMEAIKQAATEKIALMPAIPKDVASLVAQDTFTPHTHVAIADESKITASVLVGSLDRLVHGRFTEHLRDLDRRLNNLTIAEAEESPVDSGHLVIEVPAESLPGFSSRFLLELAPSYRRGVVSTIYGYKGALTLHLERLSSLLGAGFPITDYSSIVQEAREGLASDISAYFNLVEVYRSGVFSSQARAPIEQLGIGIELGRIEEDFSEEHRTAITTEADRTVFPDAELKSSGFGTRLVTLKGLVMGALSDLRPITLRDVPTSEVAVRSAFASDRARLASSLEGRVSANVNHRLSELSTALLKASTEVSALHSTQIAEAQKARNRLYRKTAAIGLGIGGLGFAAYFFMSGYAGTTIGSSVGLGLIVEIIAGGFGLAVGKLRDDFPERTKNIAARATDQVRRMWTDAIDSAGKDTAFLRSAEVVVASEVASAYREAFASTSDEEWERSSALALSAVRDIEQRLASIVTSYRGLADKAFRVSAHYLRDADANLIKLGSISTQIRARAIQPSFDFLDGVQRSLQALRDRLSAISFV